LVKLIFEVSYLVQVGFVLSQSIEIINNKVKDYKYNRDKIIDYFYKKINKYENKKYDFYLKIVEIIKDILLENKYDDFKDFINLIYTKSCEENIKNYNRIYQEILGNDRYIEFLDYYRMLIEDKSWWDSDILIRLKDKVEVNWDNKYLTDIEGLTKIKWKYDVIYIYFIDSFFSDEVKFAGKVMNSNYIIITTEDYDIIMKNDKNIYLKTLLHELIHINTPFNYEISKKLGYYNYKYIVELMTEILSSYILLENNIIRDKEFNEILKGLYGNLLVWHEEYSSIQSEVDENQSLIVNKIIEIQILEDKDSYIIDMFKKWLNKYLELEINFYEGVELIFKFIKYL